ncbi:ArsI/CadI family heavy metal resistance metalloenzyme [Marinoscillum furvescens]|uniref:Catechol 2,3-dioxygenase-like lactoylglutathione lyase family enzyme n=1 Tax=Marinoscillum furvescens DSM 4134 TaxID=1122208 RepID=A0A3D9L4D3_MARFU|nr:ArsI/CadI family heavy metal resistance metalloenzyme [Marinoscillum furvescens]REE00475.1 catechol 2,3-dioxygenase-like lactoylglutathione lyase family enzyme [Marinoscillum furvescens DSM 4134]
MTDQQLKFHVAIHVSDISKTKAFYQRLFDAQPVKEKPDYLKFELDNPGLIITFLQVPQRVQKDFGHLGLKVMNAEILKERKAAIQKELTLGLEEESTNCCYARQDKFWISDPDGYEWEVYHLIEDVEVNDQRPESAACC